MNLKIRLFQILLLSHLITAVGCGPGPKIPGTESAATKTTLASPANFIVNGTNCPSASCPANIYTLTSGTSVTIQASADTTTISITSSDTQGSFDNQNFTDGVFIFTTPITPGQSKQIAFTAKNAENTESVSATLTINASQLSLKRSLSLLGSNNDATSGSYKMKSFGVGSVGAKATATSGTTQLTLGFSNAVGGVNP